MRAYWLSFHVDYACRHSGACCTSGWPIPVERNRVVPIQRVVESGTASAATPWLDPAPEAPDDVAGTLALRPTGECVFFELPTRIALPTRGALPSSGKCAVHSVRPASCAHFPYVCLIDARGVRVTLSHYCPTAASLLFDHRGPTAIVEAPAPGLDAPEGLDAREALPPLRHETRLMSFEEFSAWEGGQVAIIKRFADSPGDDDERLFDAARAAVPAPLTWPGVPEDAARIWSALVAPAWPGFAEVEDRYLAAKLFACWSAYLGDGTRAVLHSVRTARAVLRFEAVRACVDAGRVLDRTLLTQAIRQSDLLLVHYADRTRLANPEPISSTDRRPGSRR